MFVCSCQKGADCQAGTSGKRKHGCCSAGEGVRGTDGGEPNAEAGPDAVRRAAGKAQNTVPKETGILITHNWLMWGS